MHPQYRFVCANCGESFVVDEVVRTDLLEDGCLYCGVLAEPYSFVRLRDVTPEIRIDAD